MRHIAVILFTLISGLAHANYYCSGKVGYLGVDETVNVSNGYGIHYLCSFKTDEEKCKVWLSMLLAAKMANKTVHMVYQNSSIEGDQSKGQCRNNGSWVAPSDKIYHINFN